MAKKIDPNAKEARDLFRVCRRFWSQRSLQKRAILKMVRVNIDGITKYCCMICRGYFEVVQVDHIKAIGSAPTTIKEVAEKIPVLFTTDLQVLCKNCHRIKTKEDNEKTRVEKLKKEVNFLLDGFGYVKVAHNLERFDLKALHTQLKKLTDSTKGAKERARTKLKIEKILGAI